MESDPCEANQAIGSRLDERDCDLRDNDMKEIAGDFDREVLKKFLDRVGDHTNKNIFPLSMPSMPVKSPTSKSPRIRIRYERKLKVWKTAVHLVTVLNALSTGDLKTIPLPAYANTSEVALGAQKASLNLLLADAANFVRSRRGLLTGDIDNFGHALQKLVKTADIDDSYLRINRRPPQQPLQADLIAEPAEVHKGLEMLDAVPCQDAANYAAEANVVDWTGKSEVILNELYEQFCFIGGTRKEYVRYFHRRDVQPLWRWVPYSQVKRIGGFSTVGKKCGTKQRKLLMQVSTLR